MERFKENSKYWKKTNLDFKQYIFIIDKTAKSLLRSIPQEMLTDRAIIVD